MIKFIDLFAGIGGIRLGFEKYGCVCVWSSEINPHACQMYQKNFGENPFNDITQINPIDIPDFDVLCAGFPCQTFSCAGKKEGFKDKVRGTLFFNICDILEIKKPKVFLLENVANLTKHDKGQTFSVIIDYLTKLGYTISYEILNAKDFGVPQNRERIIIVGVKSNIPFDFSKIVRQPCESMLPFLDSNVDFEYLDKSLYTILDSKYIKKQKSGLIFCGYKKGNLRKKGIKENTEHLSRVHKQPNRIYDCNGIHPTLSSSETAGRYYIKTQNGVRKLTLDECYRFMGFPDNFEKIEPRTQLLSRIGNSVCVPMIESIAKEIIIQCFDT